MVAGKPAVSTAGFPSRAEFPPSQSRICVVSAVARFGMYLRNLAYICGYLCVGNCSKDLYLESTKGRPIASIHRIADKALSRKPPDSPGPLGIGPGPSGLYPLPSGAQRVLFASDGYDSYDA